MNYCEMRLCVETTYNLIIKIIKRCYRVSYTGNMGIRGNKTVADAHVANNNAQRILAEFYIYEGI